MRKKENNPSTMIRTAGAAADMHSVAAIAYATGIPQTTLRRKLKKFSTLSAGELSAIMQECPSITDEMMGKAIREAIKW